MSHHGTAGPSDPEGKLSEPRGRYRLFGLGLMITARAYAR